VGRDQDQKVEPLVRVGSVEPLDGVVVLGDVKDRARTRDFFRGYAKKAASLTSPARDDG